MAEHGSVSCEQSGTWIIQPGNTANTTPWITLNWFSTRSDTFTGAGNGISLDLSSKPVKYFSIQVKGTGAAATLWDARLEGSLDGTNFTQILQHTNGLGDLLTVFSGASAYPSLYIRSRIVTLTLGSATNVVVTILGMN